jgi:hypothetical protein
MPTSPAPTFQIRIIGPRDSADQLLHHLTQQVTPLFGPHVRYTSQVRTARRTGYVRAYFTVTPKEPIP